MNSFIHKLHTTNERNARQDDEKMAAKKLDPTISFSRNEEMSQLSKTNNKSMRKLFFVSIKTVLDYYLPISRFGASTKLVRFASQNKFNKY